MSLYRKYRPQSFADVVGQDAVVTTLEQAANQNKLAHAFLFAGGRGTGKTSVARILAKIIMIQGIEDEVLEKQIVKGVEEGHLVDLLEIDAASNRGIDDVRDLIEKIQFSPVVARAKVYIIDEVHMLTKEAFNALLKTLEEPPPYAYFILATTELTKIPATIQSRCQCFPFRSISEEDIIRRLQFIADQEHIKIDRDALRAIAHHVQGSMRDAISALDQMRSLANISLEDVRLRIGRSGDEYVETMFEALAKRDLKAVIEIVRKVEEDGIALEAFLHTLLSVVRRTLHEAIENKESIAEAQKFLDVLLHAIRDVRIAPVPGLVLEAALLSLCQDTEHPVTEKMLKVSLPEKKDKIQEKDITKTSAQKDLTMEQGKDIKSATIEAPELSLDALSSVWEQIINEVSPASVKMSLKNAELQSLQDSKVLVSFSSVFHRDKVAHPDASRTIEGVMQKIFHRSLKLECTLGEKDDSSKSSDEAVVDLAEAAAEIF